MIIYYTDWHDVDEELRTFTRLGGHWNDASSAGIAYRFLYDAPTESGDGVASVQKINRTYSPRGDACFSFDKR